MPHYPCDAGMPLSRGEIRVLSLLAEGCSIAEAADRLWVTQAAVKWHIGRAYKKLGVRNRREAMAAYFNYERFAEATGVVAALSQSLVFLEVALQRARTTAHVSTIPTP